MPELPEVESLRLSLLDNLLFKTVTNLILNAPKLRYELSNDLLLIIGKKLTGIKRIAKYMIWQFEDVEILLHLGMSASFKINSADMAYSKHEHVDFIFDNLSVRFYDPRRFGFIVIYNDFWKNKLLSFGPDALSEIDIPCWYNKNLKNKRCLFSLLMDQNIIAGLGNIYVQESLFLTGLSPLAKLHEVDISLCEKLFNNIRIILNKSLLLGGSSLRDHRKLNGDIASFQLYFNVYSRGGLFCCVCANILQKIKITQRSVVFCPNCQR